MQTQVLNFSNETDRKSMISLKVPEDMDVDELDKFI